MVETTLSVSLLFEVLLIAMQAWRGESSHFNSTGLFNASVEKGMLFLIAIAMVLICWIAVRSFLPNQLDGVPREMRLAIQAGMGFLVVSGMIGFAITFLGNLNVSLGMSPEIWPPTGVMKFPHGAALHAVQILTVAAWISRRISSRNGTFAVGFAILSHIIWLAYALYQTVQGRDRFDTSSASWVLIVLTTATAIGAIWNLLPKRSIDAIRRSKLHDQLG